VPFLLAALPAPAPLASSAVLLPPCLLVRWEAPAQEPWQQGLQQQKRSKGKQNTLQAMHEAGLRVRQCARKDAAVQCIQPCSYHTANAKSTRTAVELDGTSIAHHVKQAHDMLVPV
jgi:hypothetical protein